MEGAEATPAYARAHSADAAQVGYEVSASCMAAKLVA